MTTPNNNSDNREIQQAEPVFYDDISDDEWVAVVHGGCPCSDIGTAEKS